MKKLLAITAALILVLSLAACGASNETAENTTANDTAASATDTAGNNETAEPEFPYLIINSEPFVVTSKDGFDNAGVSTYICDATATYTFKANSDVEWKVFVLDEKFDDGARYLPQAETPALIGDGVLDIEEGKYIYIACGESSFTADSPSDARLEINYADGLTGFYQDSHSQRASAVVFDEGDNVNINIHWGGSATEAATWEMNCTKDGNKLVYKDCVKKIVSFENETENTETVYENGEGYFTFKDGVIFWDGAAEEDCVECSFEMMQMQ